MMASIYFIVFKKILKIDIQNYTVFLITGYFPFIYISNVIVQGTNTYLKFPTLVRKVRVRKIIFNLSSLLFETIHFFLTLPIIIIFIYFYNLNLFFSWLWQIPLIIFFQIILLLPFVTLFSIMNVFYRDISNILNIFFQLLFFLSPIVYSISKVPEEYIDIYTLNPIVKILNLWRDIFLKGFVNFQDLQFLSLILIFPLILSFLVYKKYSNKIPEML